MRNGFVARQFGHASNVSARRNRSLTHHAILARSSRAPFPQKLHKRTKFVILRPRLFAAEGSQLHLVAMGVLICAPEGISL